MKLQIFLFQIHSLIILTQQRCAFTVDENDNPIPTDQEPFIIGEMVSCPMFSNQPVCCVQSQITTMANDYQSLDATFGSDGGGCDICASNMKRFWCTYTCSPNQSDFIKVGDYKNMTDPRDPSKIIVVQMIDLTVHPDVACDVYSSCARTSFASQVSAMSTPGGFFSFQGEQAAGGGGQYINVEFNDQDSLYIDNIQQCNNPYNYTTIDEEGITHFWDEFGYEQKEPCGCNTCDLSCDDQVVFYTPPGVMYGFEGYYVLFAWGWALMAGIGLTVYRRCMSKNNEIEDQQEEDTKQKLIHIE